MPPAFDDWFHYQMIRRLFWIDSRNCFVSWICLWYFEWISIKWINKFMNSRMFLFSRVFMQEKRKSHAIESISQRFFSNLRTVYNSNGNWTNAHRELTGNKFDAQYLCDKPRQWSIKYSTRSFDVKLNILQRIVWVKV